MAKTTRRISLSLPVDQVEDLDLVADFLGVTRTSLVSSLLEQSLRSAVSLAGEFKKQGITPSELDSAEINDKVKRCAYDALDQLSSLTEELRHEVDTLQ